jgi:hypothetical protein
MDLTDVYSVFHPGTAQYTFISEAHENILHNRPYLRAQKQISTNVRKLK